MMVHLVSKSSGVEIPVPTGETSVGRGPFLKVADKRVSRLHATLRLQDGTLALCPKHKNPCFYKAAGEAKYEVLPKDQWKDLHHGDFFSLLPDDLVFSVVYENAEQNNRTDVEKTPPIAAETAPPTVEKTLPVVDSGDPLDMLFGADNPPSDTTQSNGLRATPMDTSSSVKSTTEAEEPAHVTSASAKTDSIAESTTKRTLERDDSIVKPKLTSTASGITGKRRTLPSWLSGLSSGMSVSKETTAPKKKRAPSKPVAPKKRAVEDEDFGSPPPKKVAKKASSARAKLSSSVESSVEEKSLKQSQSVKASKTRISDESSVEEKSVKDSSVDSKGATGKNDTHTSAASSDSKDSTKPVCSYGSSCYRKNPAHFKEYSHDLSAPGSVDSAVGSVDTDDPDKPICPYGLDCYRKNPAHIREYRHIDVPAKKKASGKRRSERTTKGKRSVLHDDSDDDGEPNTYDYNDSFIDDEEENGAGGDSSSYGDSEDSDWAPAVKDDSEDVGELVSEAKDFMSNEKMRRTT